MELKEAFAGYVIFKSARASPETIKTEGYYYLAFERFITPLFGDNPVYVQDITTQHIELFFDALRKQDKTPSTLKRHWALLSAFWSWLCSPDINLVDKHIMKPIPIPKLPQHVIKTLSESDIRKLMDASTKMKGPRRARALILFFLDSGARVSEVAGVQLPELDLKTGRVLVTGKGSKERYVFLGRRALQSVWLYIKQERPEPLKWDSEHLFLTNEGYPMNRDNLRKAINRIGDAAGFHVYPHLFRHTCAIERLRRGMDLMSLKALLGHAKLETTEKYLTALNSSDVEKTARKTSPADDWRL